MQVSELVIKEDKEKRYKKGRFFPFIQPTV